jgi:hypothetical protein
MRPQHYTGSTFPPGWLILSSSAIEELREILEAGVYLVAQSWELFPVLGAGLYRPSLALRMTSWLLLFSSISNLFNGL